MRLAFDLSLYLVTDRDLSLGRSLKAVVKSAVKGGVTMVQLREKNASTRDFIHEAREIKLILKKFNVPLIINDRLDVALAVEADGVHLGQTDMHWRMARQLLGPDKLIGLSIESSHQLHEANDADIDYIGISPVFITPTKIELTRGLGMSKTREIALKSRHPSVAIGGIHLGNAHEVLATGINGISVVSAICSNSDPEDAAKELLKIINQSKHETS
jgi:thiamine-phosphate pyrophosphorylase